MKFIIPQNYDFSTKLFGVIDYPTAILNLLWYAIVFCIINMIVSAFVLKLFLFIIFCFPVFLFSVIGFNHESIVYVLFYIIKYAFSQKIYLYK